MTAERYIKRPVAIEAVQWHKQGDHPEVVAFPAEPMYGPDELHDACGGLWHSHGWIATLEGGHIVCPGDWIITGVAGEHYPCKPDIFDATYFREADLPADVLAALREMADRA